MSRLAEFIKALVPHFPSQRDLDEAYLAESVDIYDLERRMSDIDWKRRNTARPQGVSRWAL